jgi:hypothetical protein
MQIFAQRLGLPHFLKKHRRLDRDKSKQAGDLQIQEGDGVIQDERLGASKLLLRHQGEAVRWQENTRPSDVRWQATCQGLHVPMEPRIMLSR